MSPEYTIAVISSLSGILGAVVGGAAAYKGSKDSANMQITQQRLEKEKEEKRNAEIAENIVVLLLYNEIKQNVNLISKNTSLDGRIVTSDEPFQYGIGIKFSLEEFNKAKFELVKHSEPYIQDIFELYDMFYKLNYMEDFVKLSKSEFKNIKATYLKWKDRFNE